MITEIFKKIFGSRNDRLLKAYRKTVLEINSLEDKLGKLTDLQLRDKTCEFKQRLQNGESIDDLLPEAFAVCREASSRCMKMRHFDVQIIGGLALHQGKIAEMRTGEGKTLTATLAVYLNALSGQGVHVITVNDYLAKRDAEWMGRLYAFLGLTVGCNLSNMQPEEKKAAYDADITYGTNNEFGFDYLRDNMVHHYEQKVQRDLHYAIIDEVDSILIDEARTPLIISGQAEDLTEVYKIIDDLPKHFTRQIGEEQIDGTGIEKPGDYILDEKSHQVSLTETGHEKAEEQLLRIGLIKPGESLYSASNILLVHHINAALRAHTLYYVNQHYVVQQDEVIIVDEFTGRLMPGRRWSDGLHQAIEAKERVTIKNENCTLATITFQNYFRMYFKLAGMTGTADTEAFEFQSIYKLETVIIPSNQKNQRKDFQDQIYKTAKERSIAVIKDIRDCYNRGQPVLVGTTSIDNSERFSAMLDLEQLPHQVLNAKHHAREAEIIAQAGKPSMITIATNMAGRGTDIVLGGNIERQIALIENDDQIAKTTRIQDIKNEWQNLHKQVKAAGGLHIVGTERHESRRIDNQLRGRAARQGDPGSSRFYLSLDDALLRIFAGERVRMIMDKLKMPEGEAIEAPMVTRAIESAQRKVEGRNFDTRKQLLQYDDVANDQRREIYKLRNEVLKASDITSMISGLRHSVLFKLFNKYVPIDSMEEQWDLNGLQQQLNKFSLDIWQPNDDLKSLESAELFEIILKAVDKAYENKAAAIGKEYFADFERSIMLQSIDMHWREHLNMLDHLRQGIHLRGYAQKDPKQEYKREAFELFEILLEKVKHEVIFLIMTIKEDVVQNLNRNNNQKDIAILSDSKMENSNNNSVYSQNSDHKIFFKNQEVAITKVSRNEPCPCQSGKKFKQCHGKLN